MARLKQSGQCLHEDVVTSMYIVTEQMCQDVIGRGDAFTAVEAVFAAMSRKDAYNFPVIREAIGHADALYGFKSGFDRAGLALGLKSGGYWPGNMKNGLTNQPGDARCAGGHCQRGGLAV